LPLKNKQSKEERMAKIKEWQENNPDKHKATISKYHTTHKEQEKEYYINNSEMIIERNSIYRINHKKEISIKLNEKRKDPLIKLRHNISNVIRWNIKFPKKEKSCLKYLLFTIEKLKLHLEAQFAPWMTWENWGLYNRKTWNDNNPSTWTWQIDHIIPQSDLPYYSMEDENFKKCWALSNLRPFSAKQNIIDGSQRVRHKKEK